jgi:glucokinase
VIIIAATSSEFTSAGQQLREMQNSESQTYLGIDIGGTKCAVALGSIAASEDQPKLLDRISFSTNEPSGPDQAIAKLLDAARTLVDRHKPDLAATGISCGSPLDPVLGLIQSPPNLSSWRDVPIVKIVREAFDVPTFLDNDANGGALAEYLFGAGRGYRNVVFVTFGSGCGAGLILDGRLYRGANCFAGEIGHIRLERNGPVGYHKAGSLEGFCSGGGIPQLLEQLRPKFNGTTCLPPNASAELVGKAAENGDALARLVLATSGRYLGRGLAYVLDILNPELVVIGSIFLRCEKFLRPAMETELNAEALPHTRSVCKIVPAGLGERVGDFAAFSIARYGCGLMMNNPG